MADPTISYFGQFPTTIVFQTSSGFNGTAQTATPQITPGVYTFPVQAGGGEYDLHDNTIRVEGVTFKGSGTLTIKKSVAGLEASIGTITGGEGSYALDILVTPSESLKFYSSGAGAVAVSASLTNSDWMG